MDFIFSLALSTHLGLQNSYNEVHPHVRFIEDGAIAGVYYNSVEHISWYAGYRIEHEKFGTELAIVTGYEDFGAIAPYLRTTYDLNNNTRLFASPTLEYKNNDKNVGIVLGIELQLK